MAVNHREDSIQLIRDTEGIDNKDRVRILSPDADPPEEVTDVTKHALYMDMKNEPGDGEPYEYEFACCTGRRFIPQRAGDANKLEGKTSAEVKAMFADGRAIFAGSGTSVTLDAEGERVHSITVNGFTKQSGSDDPSPSNVRKLTNGGLKLVAVTFDGGGDEGWVDNGGGIFSTTAIQSTVKKPSSNTVAAIMFTGSAKTVSIETLYSSKSGIGVNVNGNINIAIPGINTVEAFKAYLRAKPLPVWYAPADESQATGLYAPIILEGGEYRATCLELTAPLCEGDSVVSWAKSGCDVEVVLTGTEDWILNPNSGTAASGSRRFQLGMSVTSSNSSASTAATAYCSHFGGTTPANTYGSNYDNTFSVQNADLQLRVAGISTVDDLKQFLAARYAAGDPVIVWYQSTAYTEADDIPVSLEEHQRAMLVLDGTEAFYALPSDAGQFVLNSTGGAAAKGHATSGLCSIALNKHDKFGSGFYFVANSTQLVLGGNFAKQFESVDTFKAKLAELHTAGTPAQFVYPVSTPLVYAHEPVEFEFVKGEDGVFTITGEADGTLDVYYKALQDGGDADKLGGKLPEYYAAAANALGQYTHTKSGTVHELTGTGDNIRFVATADFAAGDTVKVNGTTCTASTMSGDALWAGFFKSGAVVVCYRTGNALNFSGGGLAAAEADKITPENLKTGVSVTVNGKTVAGTFTADGTAAAGDMLLGKTGYVKGQKVTGTIPSKAAASYKPGTSAQTIKAVQYLSGDQTIEGDAALIAANIKYGASIFDVDGSFTGDGNAAAAEILAGKIGYVKGQKVTGSMPNRGAVSQSLAINGTYTIPAGYHNGSGKVTQSIPTKGAASYRPGTSAQTIAAGQYLSGAQTIQGDGNLVAGNIRKGVSIFGVAGTYDPAPSGTLVWCGYGETRNEANEDVAINGVILQGSPYFRVDNSNKVTCIKACTIRIAFNYWRYTEAGLTATLSIRKNGSQIASVYADNNQNATKRYTSGNISVNVGDYFTFRTTGQNASFRKDGCFAYIP